MWQHLIEIALLGTEKKQLDQEQIPEALQLEQSFFKKSDQQERFLKIAAMVDPYLEAGTMPKTYNGEFNENPIEEKQEYISKNMQTAFKKIKELQHSDRNVLLNYWLDVIIKQERIVPSNMLVAVIKHGNTLSNSNKAKVLQIIGNRGVWLLPKINSISYKQNGNQEEWEHANLKTRKMILQKLRQESIDKATVLIESTWEQDSIRDKKAFLEIIANTVDSSDLEFIEKCYINEFAFSPKEKKTTLECRRICGSILLKYEQSRLHQETTEKITSIFNKNKKGILGRITGKQKVEIDMNHTFWDKTYFLHTFGLGENPDIAIYNSDAQYWLSYLLSNIKIEFWREQLSKSIKETIQYFLTDKAFLINNSKKKYKVLQLAILKNAIQFKNSELINLLLVQLEHSQLQQLLQVVPTPTFEAYIRKTKRYGDVGLFNERIADNGASGFSEKFSYEIIEYVYNLLTDNKQYIPIGLARAIAASLHINAKAALEIFNAKAQLLVRYNHWAKTFYDPINSILEIKEAVSKETI